MNTEIESQSTMKNKGTCGGGANTNLYGKKFEEKTDNQPRLLDVYAKFRTWIRCIFKLFWKRR
jgi:hypothetical protein